MVFTFLLIAFIVIILFYLSEYGYPSKVDVKLYLLRLLHKYKFPFAEFDAFVKKYEHSFVFNHIKAFRSDPKKVYFLNCAFTMGCVIVILYYFQGLLDPVDSYTIAPSSETRTIGHQSRITLAAWQRDPDNKYLLARYIFYQIQPYVEHVVVINEAANVSTPGFSDLFATWSASIYSSCNYFYSSSVGTVETVCSSIYNYCQSLPSEFKDWIDYFSKQDTSSASSSVSSEVNDPTITNNNKNISPNQRNEKS